MGDELVSGGDIDGADVRAPQQRRSREAWGRVLDAGVAILEEGGYDAFTISAICARAAVGPPTIYRRASTKDALFLAVYEHGLSRLRADSAAFDDEARWTGLPPELLVREAVVQLVDLALRHRSFLRVVVLVSGVHREVQRRGSAYSRSVGAQFTGVLLHAADAFTHSDPVAAAWSCFDTVFSTSIFRVAYGADFASARPTDDATFGADLAEAAARYLLGRVQPLT